MGSSCSSAQKKDKERQNAAGGQSPIGGRRQSADSIVYGKGSPPSFRRSSFDPNSAPAPVAETAESPSEVTKTPVGVALSHASVGGGSSSSPPPTGMSGTPIAKDAPGLDITGLPDLQQFPEQVRFMLLGQVSKVECQPQLQEISLYVSADYYDSAVERNSLSERVFPVLRRYTAERGYELNIMDLHWGVPGVGIVDHNLRDLCIETLEKWRTRRRLLTLVLFNDNIGVPLLPRTLPKPHFESAVEAMPNETDRELFNKWYKLDENISPSGFVLQPVCVHLPEVTCESVEKRKIAMDEWKLDAQTMIQLLKDILPDAQKNRYLTSVLQEEIKLIVNNDPQEAKRVLWMQRRFTHQKPTGNGGPSPDTRRIDQTKVQLEDYLPDTQKLVFYVKWSEGGLDPSSIEEHDRYISEVCDALRDEIKKMIDSVLEEDFLDEAQQPYKGIESGLYNELIQQSHACQRLCQGFIGQEDALESVKSYLHDPSSNHPFIIHGPPGCGKSALIAKVTEQCFDWLGATPVVTRLVGLTAESDTQEQLIRSIAEQCCALYGEHPAVASESFQGWGSGLGKLLERVSEMRPLVLIIDGLDQVKYFSSRDLQWLPKELPAHVKLILTARDDSEELQKIKELLEDEKCFICLEHLSLKERVSSVDNLLKSHKKHLTQNQKQIVETSLQESPSVLYCELLSHLTLQWPSALSSPPVETSAESLMLHHLTQAENFIGASLVTIIIGLLLSAKHGLSESEVVDILSCNEDVINLVFCDGEPQVRRFPFVMWAFSKKCLNLFLSSQVLSGRSLTKISSCAYRTVAEKYITEKNHSISKNAAPSLMDYFFGKWAEGHKKSISASEEDEACGKDRFVLDQPLAYGPNPNRRKLDELPFQILHVQDSIRENFLFDATWLLYKFCGSDPYQLLEDVASYERTKEEVDPELKVLSAVVQLSSYALRCDGSQFFAQMYGRLKGFLTDNDNVKQFPALFHIFETASRPPLSSLLPIGRCLREPSVVNSGSGNWGYEIATPDPPSSASNLWPFSSLYTIKEDNAHIISLSPDLGEMVLWNIYEQSPVRKFVGMNQPKDIKMIDKHRALVLCNRELKVYHLDQGTLVVKLKGVMNQKMAYYGLHDENYVVALSRNRMYVNMTNLNTGDLETTFKVGEDRFLNSLLVSANGRICVCGDETQKPFPLLVWDLTSRKLVYDLRIPHNEFITRLSAISDDGHYVVSACRGASIIMVGRYAAMTFSFLYPVMSNTEFHAAFSRDNNVVVFPCLPHIRIVELHDTSPNFIIVYDLQSGTLFKKWKPESSSCSIAISSQGGCVVNGLENTWVLVWDLSTGARRYTLRGHSAPVDQIRMEEEGKRCLTYDSKGRDRSIRVWDVAKGECLAVFTPDQEFICCELSLDGRAVILGLRGQEQITTYLLCRESSVEDETPPSVCYGDPERKHKIFDMSQEGQ